MRKSRNSCKNQSTYSGNQKISLLTRKIIYAKIIYSFRDFKFNVTFKTFIPVKIKKEIKITL